MKLQVVLTISVLCIYHLKLELHEPIPVSVAKGFQDIQKFFSSSFTLKDGKFAT